MALPTQKRSKSRQKRKQYQYRLKKIFLSICAKCQKLKPSHQACPFCGTYAGREIIKEVSRMLSGKKESSISIMHAEELINQCNVIKKNLLEAEVEIKN